MRVCTCVRLLTASPVSLSPCRHRASDTDLILASILASDDPCISLRSHADAASAPATRTVRPRLQMKPARRSDATKRAMTALIALIMTAAILCAIPALADTVRLTPGASSLEENFPENRDDSSLGSSTLVQGYPSRALASLSAAVITSAYPLVAQAAAAYKASQPDFDLKPTDLLSNEQVKSAFFASGSVDFAVSTVGPSTADYRATPSLVYFPLQANGVVPCYNLPESATTALQLALTGETLCRIFRGNITMWNDPAILASNPGTALGTAAGNHPIRIMLMSTSSASYLAFTTYCAKVDPEFAAVIPRSAQPIFPDTLNSRTLSDVDRMNSAVADEPYSLAISTLSNTAPIFRPVAALVNRRNEPVMPTSNSMSLTLFELATAGYPAGSTSFDLTNPHTLEAWPIMTMSYVYLDSSRARTTCANKRKMLQFLLFFFQSDIVRSIADSLSMAAFPSVFVAQLGLIQRLQAEMTCLDSPLVSATEQRSYMALNGIVAPAMTLFSSFYLGVDSKVVFVPAVVPVDLAVQRVAMGENSLAVVNTAYIGETEEALMVMSDMQLIPAFMAGISPIFTLPTAITQLAANVKRVAALALPPLYPLVLNMEVCTLLFIGEIASWLDPRFTALNPQLPAWFAAAGAPTEMHIIVGESAPNGALTGARLLFARMRETSIAAQYPWAFVAPAATSGPDSNPFLAVASANITSSRANFSIIERESRLTVKCQSMPGSVSYRPARGEALTTEEFQFTTRSSFALGERRDVVPSSYSSLEKCGSRLSRPEGSERWNADRRKEHLQYLSLVSTQRGWVDIANPEASCWPLSSLFSFAVKLKYSSAASPTACFSGLHALEFVHYIQSTDILSPPSVDFGLARLGSLPLIDALSRNLLYEAQCDGQSLLVIPPIYYSVPSSISTFGQAVAAIGLVVMFVSLAVVVKYRHKVVIRSASAPFLCVILLGMALLLGAMVSWSVPPSKSSCSSFLWLANLGYMLLFVPLFLRTWRVWRIFSGAHLRIVKITNQKLLLATVCIVLADVVFVSVWQGVAPLQPIQYSALISGDQHVFTHCSVTSSGSGVVFIALAGVEKVGLLFFGAVMAFSTRNVKGTFNESATISWTIYNTLMTLILGLSIIIFVHAVETTLMLLVLLVIMWLVFSAWGLLFVPKFHLLFQTDEEVIEASRSELAQEKSNGFSFASIALMTTGQVKAYLVALRLQVNKAERQLSLPQTVFATATIANVAHGGGKSTAAKSAVNAGKVSGGGESYSQSASCSYVSDMAPAPKDPQADKERSVLNRAESVQGLTHRRTPSGPQPSSKASFARPSPVSRAATVTPQQLRVNVPPSPPPQRDSTSPSTGGREIELGPLREVASAIDLPNTPLASPSAVAASDVAAVSASAPASSAPASAAGGDPASSPYSVRVYTVTEGPPTAATVVPVLARTTSSSASGAPAHVPRHRSSQSLTGARAMSPSHAGRSPTAT